MVREPAQAGLFYAASSAECTHDLENIFRVDFATEPLPARPLGGIVPHAGWRYSGQVAARVFAAVAARREPATIVVFGAVHHPIKPVAALYGRGAWTTPLGDIRIDDRLAERILGQTTLVEDDPYAHEPEHSIEVQVPLLQHRFPEAKLVPIMVRPCDQAVQVGAAVGRTVAAYDLDVVFIGSSDLTHYGPRFGFTPQGCGPDALRWAKEVNDCRVIDEMLALRADRVLAEARENQNACGSGAIAATIAACRELGATVGHLLAHTTSAEAAPELSADDGAVGYAGILFS